MKELWSRFTGWLSGWPVSEENKIKEETIDKSVKESQARKAKKKPKGLNPKKKKTRKQGNMK